MTDKDLLIQFNNRLYIPNLDIPSYDAFAEIAGKSDIICV